jgi:non-ribosomal peptide synthetase-like protein
MNITILSCVPTLLQMMGESVDTVRILIVGGEACPPRLIDRWAADHRRMFNTYGPTEATVIATWTECFPNQPVTIGSPLPGYRAEIVSESMERCTVGEAGELLLGGIGLSKGYVGLPELTQEKFIPDPFELNAPSINTKTISYSEKLYRTGDLCRWNVEGEIEYLGRIDTQVKIRGYRVELSEIEAVLLTSGLVQTIAVTLREDQPGLKQLVAYVVPSQPETFQDQALRDFARRALPVYMVPALIETLDVLPTLASGKIDRRSLPAPNQRGDANIECVDDAGVTPAEALMLVVWRRVFSPLPVHLNSDFFRDLGGDSLVAAGMISELRQRDPFRAASMFAIYQHPTLHAFTASVASKAMDAVGNRLDTKHDEVVSQSPVTKPQVNRVSAQQFAWCGFFQMLGLYFVLGLAGIQWLAPFATYSYLHDSQYTVVESLLGGLLSLIVIYPPLVMFVVLLKWTLLGRLKEGSYPLWGWFYWRWWFVRSVEAVVPINYLVGTPFLAMYARMMGAKIGEAVHLGSDTIGTYDLVNIGDRTSISSDASLLGYRVADGMLTLGPITIGDDCYVGTRAMLCEHTSMQDQSSLGDLSMLLEQQCIGTGENWEGSPAAKVHTKERLLSGSEAARLHGTAWRRFWFGAVQMIGVMIMPAVVVAALLPGMATMHHLNSADDYYWYLALSPMIGLSFISLLSMQILLLKWLVLGRVRPGAYSLYGGFSIRKWYIDQLMDLSIDVLGPLYSTLYLAPWYRALGAKIGRFAEVSTASFISPDLLSLGEGSFIADIVSLGGAKVSDGKIVVDHVRVGARSFVGNSAVIPIGTTLEENCLIGCLSVPPKNPTTGAIQVEDSSSWVGSPAMQLPHRTENKSFSEEQTYRPSKQLVTMRLLIEFFRVVLPSAGFLCVAGLMFSYLSVMRDEIPLWGVWALFPIVYLLACMLFISGFILLKWMVMGRYRPMERPLWSGTVWRTELITALHDFFCGPLLLVSLRGTPMLAWYFRLLGSKIGKRVFLDSVQISEFDLVQIENDAVINTDATLQTHLFEDRVMKMSHVHIGEGCNVGAESLVLYNTHMKAGSTLGGLSLLMKGEILPENTDWTGTPARGGP